MKGLIYDWELHPQHPQMKGCACIVPAGEAVLCDKLFLWRCNTYVYSQQIGNPRQTKYGYHQSTT